MPSIWDRVNSERKELSFWKWPNPFNTIKRIDVLACNPNWLARIEFYTMVQVELFWTNFIPSPSEIIRNWVLGNYACGKKMKVGLKSPIELLPGKGLPVVMAEIARPALTGLFYWWAASTAWTMLDTWQTVINAQAECDADTNSGIMRDASGSLSAPATGTPVGGTTVWDPNNWANDLNYFFEGEQGHWRGYASMVFHNQGEPNGITFRTRINAIAGTSPEWQTYSLGLNEVVNVSLWGSVQSRGVGVEFEVLSAIPTPFARLFVLSPRFYCWYSPNPFPDVPWNLIDDALPSTYPDCIARVISEFNPPAPES